MGEWINTPFGNRYKEESDKIFLFFTSEPDECGKREIPREILDIIWEDKI